MPKYIAVFSTSKPFTPQNYPTLYAFLQNIPNGIHLKSGVMLFVSPDEQGAVCDNLYEHLNEGDELTMFQISSAIWRCDRLKNGAARDQQMRHFLGSETTDD